MQPNMAIFFRLWGLRSRSSEEIPGFFPRKSLKSPNLPGWMSEHMKILTNYEAIEVRKEDNGQKTVVAKEQDSREEVKVTADEILVATGRVPNTDILHLEKAGIKTDLHGWILVNDYLETSQQNIWAFGDANGNYLFKHVGNYESGIVYLNAILKEKVTVDYHAIPHAVFSYPEIAGVGMGEQKP